VVIDLLFRKKEEKTILLGLNEISICLARKISLQKDVIILDQDNTLKEQYLPEADVIIEELQNGLFSTLKNHQINDAGYFMALTGDDEYNLFAAELSKRLGVGKAVAMIHSNDYTEYKSEIDLIFDPYQLFIDQMYIRIRDTGLMNIKNLIPDRINISKIMVREKDLLSYRKIKELNLKEGIVVAVQQGKRIQLPDPDLRLLPGNSLFIINKRGIISLLFNKKKSYLFSEAVLWV
jgi:trk system potassium uptake protein